MRKSNDAEGHVMESNEFSIELDSVELGDPQDAVTDLIEFDDLDTIKLPASTAANNYGANVLAADEEIEVSIEFEDSALEIELQADDIDALLTRPEKSA